MAIPASPHVFPGSPSFFQACILDVKSQMRPEGYAHPARELMRHIERFYPDAIDLDEWAEELKTGLFRFIAARDEEAVLCWFLRFFPQCLELVPKRRRGSFVKGACRAAREFGYVAR